MVIRITRTPPPYGRKCLIFVVTNSSLPMFYMGDMNDIMHANEKLGPGRHDLWRINAFCDHVK
jgi:hypothetical protein